MLGIVRDNQLFASLSPLHLFNSSSDFHSNDSNKGSSQLVQGCHMFVGTDCVYFWPASGELLPVCANLLDLKSRGRNCSSPTCVSELWAVASWNTIPSNHLNFLCNRGYRKSYTIRRNNNITLKSHKNWLIKVTFNHK